MSDLLFECYFDIMSIFNDKLKKITLKELLLLIILLFLFYYIVNNVVLVSVNVVWVYIFIIFYFIFRLNGSFSSLKGDLFEVFSSDWLRLIFFIVVGNIFFSYGMLYLSGEFLNILPDFNVFNSILGGSLISTVIVSPISEELMFRGVFLNRLRLILPTVFAVLVSSLFFAVLHSFGSIFSAFVFGLCISVLYLKSDNILIPIFAHFLNNLFAEIIVNADKNCILFNNMYVMVVVSLLAVFSFVLILKFLVKELNTINNNNF